jgi:pyruvate formate lyase activating enzyme
MPRDEKRIVGQKMSPAEVVKHAEKAGCKSISYTYTEPTIFYEYAFDTAKLAKEKGIYNSFVTNGYIEDQPLKAIKPYLDGANIDLKSFNQDFYRKVCGAELKGVIDTIQMYKALDIWIELTTLVIPTYNDSDDEFRSIARFIKNELGAETPWHVSAFSPTYKLTDAPRTPAKTLKRARDIGLEEGLRYVYEGNVVGSEGENTFCWSCGKTIIRRYGYTISEHHIKDGACTFCNATIDGVGM